MIDLFTQRNKVTKNTKKILFSFVAWLLCVLFLPLATHNVNLTAKNAENAKVHPIHLGALGCLAVNVLIFNRQERQVSQESPCVFFASLFLCFFAVLFQCSTAKNAKYAKDPFYFPWRSWPLGGLYSLRLCFLVVQLLRKQKGARRAPCAPKSSLHPTCISTGQRRNETIAGTLSNIQKPTGIRTNVRHNT